MILLENKSKFLPLAPAGKKVFLYGVDPAVAAEYGLTVVDAPEKADFAIVRTTSAFQSEHPNMGMGNNTREGRLDYRESDPGYEALTTASSKVPTVMIVRMNRPAILTNVKDKTVALLADFGADDHAALDVLIGKALPGGHFPYELPSSMDAVEMQRSDLPHDSLNPLYPYGYGLSY